MCCAAVISATNGLFMDWRGVASQSWHWLKRMDLDRFLLLLLWAKIGKFLQSLEVFGDSWRCVGFVPKRTYAIPCGQAAWNLECTDFLPCDSNPRLDGKWQVNGWVLGRTDGVSNVGSLTDVFFLHLVYMVHVICCFGRMSNQQVKSSRGNMTNSCFGYVWKGTVGEHWWCILFLCSDVFFRNPKGTWSFKTTITTYLGPCKTKVGGSHDGLGQDFRFNHVEFCIHVDFRVCAPQMFNNKALLQGGIR